MHQLKNYPFLTIIFLFISYAAHPATYSITASFINETSKEEESRWEKTVENDVDLVGVFKEFKNKIAGIKYWAFGPELWQYYYGYTVPLMGFDPVCGAGINIIKDETRYFTQEHLEPLDRIAEQLSFPSFLPRFIQLGKDINHHYFSVTGKKISDIDRETLISLQQVSLKEFPDIIWPIPINDHMNDANDVNVKELTKFVLYQHWLSRAGFSYPIPDFYGFVLPEIADRIAWTSLFADHMCSFHWLHGSLTHLLGAVGSRANTIDIRHMVENKKGDSSLWGNLYDQIILAFKNMSMEFTLSEAGAPLEAKTTLSLSANAIPTFNHPVYLHYQLLLGSWSRTLEMLSRLSSSNISNAYAGLKITPENIASIKALENAILLTYLEEWNELKSIFYSDDFGSYLKPMKKDICYQDDPHYSLFKKYYSNISSASSYAMSAKRQRFGYPDTEEKKPEDLMKSLLREMETGNFPPNPIIPFVEHISKHTERTINYNDEFSLVLTHTTSGPQQPKYQQQLTDLLNRHGITCGITSNDNDCLFSSLIKLFSLHAVVNSSQLRQHTIEILQSVLEKNEKKYSHQHQYLLQAFSDSRVDIQYEIENLRNNFCGGVQILGVLAIAIKKIQPALDGFIAFVPDGGDLKILHILPNGQTNKVSQEAFADKYIHLPVLIHKGVNQWHHTYQNQDG